MKSDLEEPSLDISEQVSLFTDFLNTYLLEKVFEVNNSDKESLLVDFSLLSQFNVQLSELVLSNPDEALKAAELALSKLDVTKKIHFRFFNFPVYFL
mgnify:CR=1 FL=1